MLTLDVEEWWVHAERPGLRQLVLNLLQNALKYGGEQVRIQVTRGQLVVHDSGSGPDPAQWERLCRPFERGQGLQAVPGSGLSPALANRWGASFDPGWSSTGFSVEVRWLTTG